MATNVKVIGADSLTSDLKKIVELMSKPELITGPLDQLMTDYVHIQTGYLRSTIYHKNAVAGADAPYAGYEEERGGSHAYATRAIENFKDGPYLDTILKPF